MSIKEIKQNKGGKEQGYPSKNNLKKDFIEWGSRKALIEEEESRPFFHEKEIWFCSVGTNIGFEIDGKGVDFLRPVIVIRKFGGSTFLGIPLSKSKKENKPFLYTFSFVKGVESTAVLSQIRLIDAKRLSHKVGNVDDVNFKEIIEKLKALLP